jgi:hypothetical protein
MRRVIHHQLFLLLILIPLTTGCNAPFGKFAPTLAFTEEDLLQTVEAMPTFTPSTPESRSTQSPPGEISTGIWPTLIPTSEGDFYAYSALPGDTLAGILGRFSVEQEQIRSDRPMLAQEYLLPGEILMIEQTLDNTSSAQRFLPDGEMVYSRTAADFDVATYIQEAGGYLSRHREVVEGKSELSGAQIIQRVASEHSVNPRLLLALLEYRSEWVFDHPLSAEGDRYPLGFRISNRQGLYEELKIAATQLNLAYYGWRAGSFTSLRFADGSSLRLHPTLNAGSVGLMHLFGILTVPQGWEDDLYSPYGFPVEYFNLFGDTWARAESFGPLLPPDLEQPSLELPFLPGQGWSLTAGPHNAWNAGTPLGALDLSPIIAGEPCQDSAVWITASAAGFVVRARDNTVALDLDGDGDEGSGWVIVYYHVAAQDMIPEGLDLAVDQRIGHPSCEGGTASGTHVHMARKFNGEWIPADGPVPFELSGWRAVAGARIYQGQLINGDQVVTADPAGRAGSTIIR